MSIAHVYAVPFPSQSKLRTLYKSAYFVDAFAVTLPAPGSKNYTLDSLARAVFQEPPTWFSLLLWIRDRVMAVFGVKRSTEIRAAAEKKGIETIAMFPVLSRSDNEIVIGESDIHLDFQTSILVRDTQFGTAGGCDAGGNEKELVAITVVHCHGVFGKVYITIIKAFHVLIVKYNLARVPDRMRRNGH